MSATLVAHPAPMLDLAEEMTVLRRARAGDRSAIDVLYRHLEPEARRYASRLVGACDVEDVVAESFTRVLNALRNGRGPRHHAVRYLMVTVRTTAWRIQRRSAAEATKVEALASEPLTTEQAPTLTDPDLAQALAQLAPRHRTAIWLSEVEGLDVTEIGDRLGLSSNAAAALTYRARQSLRRAYLVATGASDHAG